MKKKWISSILILCMLFALAGCSPAAGNPAEEAGEGGKEESGGSGGETVQVSALPESQQRYFPAGTAAIRFETVER